MITETPTEGDKEIQRQTHEERERQRDTKTGRTERGEGKARGIKTMCVLKKKSH